jgi:hypothetical protein
MSGIHSFTGAYSPGWTFGLPPFQGFLIRHTTGLLWMSDMSGIHTVNVISGTSRKATYGQIQGDDGMIGIITPSVQYGFKLTRF